MPLVKPEVKRKQGTTTQTPEERKAHMHAIRRKVRFTPKLTQKQRIFIKEYLRTGNLTKSSIRAWGMKPKAAQVYGSITMKRPHVKEYVRQLLDKAELTDEKIVIALKRLMDAGTTEKALGTADAKLGLAAVKEIARLKDLYPAEKKEIESKTAKLNIDIKGKTEEELLESLNKINSDIRQFKEMIKHERKITAEKPNKPGEIEEGEVIEGVYEDEPDKVL